MTERTTTREGVIYMTEAQQTERQQNRTRPAAEIVHLLPEEAKPYVYRVGAWLWAEFPTRPSQETRTRLIELGFSWNSTRRVWQHTGGVFRHRSAGDPRAAYGVEQLEEVTA